MNRDEAIQWIMSGHGALVVEENMCDDALSVVNVDVEIEYTPTFTARVR